jgi:putative salt-induced outer membrane protein YdiY
MIVRSSPSYTLQFNLDYNQAILELSGAYNDDYQSETVYAGESFGADKGYGLSAISKITLNEYRGTIRFTQSLTFNRILSYTFGDKTNIADNGYANYNCFTGGLGLEYNFTPAHMFKIYVGGELNASMINGDIRIWFLDRNGATEDYTVTNTFRMGYGFMMGSEYLINDKFGLNFGVRLLNTNAFLRKSEGTNDDNEFKLRDAAEPNLNFAGNNTKNFCFYSMMFGVNFYFGIKEKRYKLN